MIIAKLAMCIGVVSEVDVRDVTRRLVCHARSVVIVQEGKHVDFSFSILLKMRYA